MKRKSFTPGALTAPLPPVLVTVGNETEANVLTIAWTGILSTIPPRTYVSVRPRRHSYTLLKEGGEFVINLPTAQMARKVDFCGIYTGKKVDKFKECGFTPVKSEKVAPPTIEECPLALECRVIEVIPMGTHDVFVADIISVSAKEEIIDRSGKLRFDEAGLLAYAHGEYYALGEKIGAFGFSTDKKKKVQETEPKDKTSTKEDNKGEFRKDSPTNKEDNRKSKRDFPTNKKGNGFQKKSKSFREKPSEKFKKAKDKNIKAKAKRINSKG